MAAIETQKFRDMVTSIGPDTIATIATSGPDMQVRVTCMSGRRTVRRVAFLAPHSVWPVFQCTERYV